MRGREHTDLMEDMRRLVSFVNWHLCFRLEHSEHDDVSVASHCHRLSAFWPEDHTGDGKEGVPRWVSV